MYPAEGAGDGDGNGGQGFSSYMPTTLDTGKKLRTRFRAYSEKKQ